MVTWLSKCFQCRLLYVLLISHNIEHTPLGLGVACLVVGVAYGLQLDSALLLLKIIYARTSAMCKRGGREYELGCGQGLSALKMRVQKST